MGAFGKADAEVLRVLEEIRDKLPSEEELRFLAVLAGAVAKRGPADGDGGAATAISEIARDFAKGIKSD